MNKEEINESIEVMAAGLNLIQKYLEKNELEKCVHIMGHLKVDTGFYLRQLKTLRKQVPINLDKVKICQKCEAERRKKRRNRRNRTIRFTSGKQ